MSCSPYELNDYFFGELGPEQRRQVQGHLEGCAGCREELERLRLTQTALGALAEEEPPRRIAFVSDPVLAPRWWQRMWQSGPRLGFASAALLSLAIVAHGWLQPPAAAPAAVNTAAIEARIKGEVEAAVAASEARQARHAAQLVAETEKRLDFDRRADRVAFEETFTVLQKKLNMMYTASASLGGRP